MSGEIDEERDESPGETAIRANLEKLELKYRQEEKISNLSDDTKQFRTADFYLPDYNIYIEYLGGWDSSEKEKERYRDKKRVYDANGIDCIYILPKHLNYVINVIAVKILKIDVERKKKGEKKDDEMTKLEEAANPEDADPNDTESEDYNSCDYEPFEMSEDERHSGNDDEFKLWDPLGDQKDKDIARLKEQLGRVKKYKKD